MERPYSSIEEQMDEEYEIELNGREATNQPWVSFEEFLTIRAARKAAEPPMDETPTTDDDIPF